MKFEKPVQDYYPEAAAICYGCGRNNPQGLYIQTFWDGEQGVCHFTPQAHHTAFPGFVYGGLLASLIDCHCIGTAIAAMYAAEGRMPDTAPEITCVTGNLNVNYVKPTPIDSELTLYAHPTTVTERKAIIRCNVFVAGVECVQGDLVAVRVRSRTTMHGHHPAG